MRVPAFQAGGLIHSPNCPLSCLHSAGFVRVGLTAIGEDRRSRTALHGFADRCLCRSAMSSYGGHGRSRTCDLVLVGDLLSQLSYASVSSCGYDASCASSPREMVGCSTRTRTSITRTRISCPAIGRWSNAGMGGTDSDLQSSVLETDALPITLRPCAFWHVHVPYGSGRQNRTAITRLRTASSDR